MPSQSNAAGQQILLACFPHRKQAQINGKVLRSGYQVRDYAFYAAISVRRNRQPSRTDESNSSLHTYTPFKINLATNCKQYSKKNGKRQERGKYSPRLALCYIKVNGLTRKNLYKTECAPMPCKNNPEKRKLVLFFFARLKRLAGLKASYEEKLNPAGERLIANALFSTYGDLIQFGHQKEAHWYIFKCKHAPRPRKPSYRPQEAPPPPQTSSPPQESRRDLTSQFLEKFRIAVASYVAVRDTLNKEFPRSQRTYSKYIQAANRLLNLWKQAERVEMHREAELLLAQYKLTSSIFLYPPFS